MKIALAAEHKNALVFTVEQHFGPQHVPTASITSD
jgi:hypothetical protein